MDLNNEEGPRPPRQTIIDAFDGLPILCRLEFVKNVLLNSGGEKGSNPMDPTLVVVAEILAGVVEVLEAHPTAAQLRSPEPT